MPELPEVETIRRDLEKEAVGRRIKSVQVTGKRAIRRHKTAKELTSRLEGEKINSISRKGKYLMISVGNSETLVIHLGMSGQLLKAATKDPVIPHTHVVITFTQGGEIRFVDPRTFGEIFVVANDAIETDAPELLEMGFDPVEDIMSWDLFGARIIAKKAKLKALLMDQKFIAGIGNIYSDEILWAAGLRYDRSTETLTTQEVRRLYRSIVEIIHDAVKHRGSSLADEQYRDLFGRLGGYQVEHKVYGHEGEACKRCRGVIVREKWSGRSTFFCPSCQV